MFLCVQGHARHVISRLHLRDLILWLSWVLDKQPYVARALINEWMSKRKRQITVSCLKRNNLAFHSVDGVNVCVCRCLMRQWEPWCTTPSPWPERTWRSSKLYASSSASAADTTTSTSRRPESWVQTLTAKKKIKLVLRCFLYHSAFSTRRGEIRIIIIYFLYIAIFVWPGVIVACGIFVALLWNWPYLSSYWFPCTE